MHSLVIVATPIPASKEQGAPHAAVVSTAREGFLLIEVVVETKIMLIRTENKMIKSSKSLI
jgi:hypothetical protein